MGNRLGTQFHTVYKWKSILITVAAVAVEKNLQVAL